MSRFQKSILAMVLKAAILVGANPTAAQDLIPVSDITGGASVFVFRSGSKAAPKRFSTKARATLSKGQRIDSSKKVTKQYTALAKVTPRRTRTAVVNPNDPRIPKIKTMSPGDASKLFAGVGEYYMDQNDYNNAITFFRESLDLDATNKVAPSGLSEALALKGNEELAKDAFPVAKTFFDEALKYNPNNGPALFGLAEVYTEQGKENDAIGNYERALANDKDLTTIYVPLGILYYQKGEIAKADDMLTKAVAASPNDAQAQYFLGLVRLAQNRNQDALAAFQLAKTIDPKNADAFYQTGEASVRLGKKAEAVEEYAQATVLRDRFFDAWFALGSVNYELGKYPESIAAYKKAVRLRNDNIETYINLGDAYRQIGSFNDAEGNYGLAVTFIDRAKDFSKEEAADVHSKIAFVIAKQCEINITQAIACKWDPAIRAVEKALSLNESSVDNANLGWVYYSAARGDITMKRMDAARPKLEKAKFYLQKAAEANPKFIEGPLLNLGMALSDLGDYAGAVDALTKVVKKEPKWVFAINELGIAYRKMNNYKEAAKHFREAIKRDENFASAHYNLAETEIQAGNLKAAKESYNRLKKMGRNDLAGQLEIISNGRVRS